MHGIGACLCVCVRAQVFAWPGDVLVAVRDAGYPPDFLPLLARMIVRAPGERPSLSAALAQLEQLAARS